MVSVIIPVFNEEKTILDCLVSLFQQSYRPLEIIVVDDGSTDKTAQVLSKYKIFPPQRDPASGGTNIKYQILKQKHLGPGSARNLGAKSAKGKILVFVDADMVYDKNFIRDLVAPIKQGKVIGTFSKEEYLLNKENIWAICWNINRYYINNWKLDSQVYKRILPTYYPDHQPVFRAILKKEFEKVSGFNSIGYTDDWTLSKKTGREAKATEGAVFYHRNPQTLLEIFRQARWIGKSEFLSGSLVRRLFNLFRYCILSSLLIGGYLAIKLNRPQFILFKLVYDFGVWLSVLLSFINKSLVK